MEPVHYQKAVYILKQFLKYLLDNGITEELFEMTYETPIEKLEVYGEWIKVRGNEG